MFIKSYPLNGMYLRFSNRNRNCLLTLKNIQNIKLKKFDSTNYEIILHVLLNKK